MDDLIKKGSNLLWVDFLANAARLSKPGAAGQLAENAAKSGITHLIVDAKIPYGFVTFPSRYAAHVSLWSDGRYAAWSERDFLAELANAARHHGLRIFANIDVFAEGKNGSGNGLAFAKKHWQVIYAKPSRDGHPARFYAAEEGEEPDVFVNPIHEEVVEHQLNVIREVAERDDLDGVVLDRCRYPNVYGDFSDLSRAQFETFLGHPVERWPDDIITAAPGSDNGISFGELFPRWTEWRAKNIRRFVQRAKAEVKRIRPDWVFSIYVGSWYPVYYNEGVNWGSSSFRPDLAWVSDRYHEAGYADELDFLMTGCYYRDVYKQEALDNGKPEDWYSVEGGIEWSARALDGKIPFAASLYLHDYEGNPAQFEKAVRLCRERSHGVMLFDVCYLYMYDWWETLTNILNARS